MKIAVIGAGRWGKNHIRTLYEMGNLGGVIDSSLSATSEIQSLYPEIPIFSSLDDVGALDFVAYTVAVPAEIHYGITKRLLNAGKHVLVEKPITLNSVDARDLVRIAEEKGVVLTTGHLLLFHPAIRKMSELIESGQIGKLQYIYSNRLNLGTVRTEENSLWSFAPHDLSIFQYFVGQTPLKVSSTGGAFLQPHIHDTTMTTITYPSNVVAHVFVSWLHPFKEHRLVVIGSKGMLSFEDSSVTKELFFYEKGIDWVNGEPIRRDGPTESISYSKESPLDLELEHFIDCINTPSLNTLINGQKGVEVLEILERAQSELLPDLPVQPDVFIHESAFVDSTASIGKGSKVWHFSNIQKNVVIGEKCILGQNVNVGNNVKIGNFCKIQNNVSVYEGVELEDYVFCGPSMVFTNILMPRCKYPQAESKFYKKTLLKEGTSIGANATIVCGITLGRFSFVGAGAVVTKDVPDFAMVVGNPARVIGFVSEGGVKLNFSKSNRCFCEKSKQWYELINGKVVEVGQPH